ncbi:MAG: 4'-phosphopantetheinyl transferase superfamily protein [Aliivibrio sp.]|uniref:4'-phosphopantetheinyl transferase family protein n=1 Tax=Aliivibrio sp. TaxID=1872443 RepID=UPI001A462311|nr:4'-phosphopantetheinyl transferase superfamily protein [Aliivibrio sp.]
MLLPIISTRKLVSHLVLDKTHAMGGFIDYCKMHSLSELHPDISVIECKFNAFHFQEQLYDRLLFNEPQNIKKAVNKRRAEFLAGRLSAMVALEKMGILSSSVATGKHRNPIWPEECVGSITHNSETALSIVAPSNTLAYVGIDREEKMSIDVAKNIAFQILSINEMEFYYRQDLDFSLFCTIVFSAKESLFKAIYPYVERYLNFDISEIVGLCIKTGKFRIVLKETLFDEIFEKNKVVDGYLELSGNVVTTVIIGNRP